MCEASTNLCTNNNHNSFIRTIVTCAPGGADEGAAARLREFIPAAAELARQRQFSQRGPRHEISALRTALRLGRQVLNDPKFPFSVTCLKSPITM